jgi:hypothetical protein
MLKCCHIAGSAAEYVVQRIGCSISQVRRKCSSPILVLKSQNIRPGIGHRMKNREV